MKRLIYILAGMTIAGAGHAQVSQAVNRIQQGKWKGAEESLRKALRKDSINPEARFIFSDFYSNAANPLRNIDSAYRYTLEAIRDFGNSTSKEKERLKRFPVDSAILIRQRKTIDSAAFERAKAINTERSYQDFLSRFVFATDQTPPATELRDEVAFVEALKINNDKVFFDYLTRYPASHRVAEARQRYEKLLYEGVTREGKLKNYESFYQAHPGSSYRREAERNIFEIMTASGKLSVWHEFLSKYPAGAFQHQAEAIVYHLAKEEEELTDSFVPTDSLKKIQRLEQGFWVPVLRHGKFGFIDRRGEEVLAPRYERIAAEYLCGNIREDYLRVEDGLLSRDGHWILKGPVQEVLDIGAGFLKLKSGTCIQIIHKSGLTLPGVCYEDAKIIAHNFIAFREHHQWGVLSLTGKILMEAQFDDIASLDDLVLLVRNGKKTVVTFEELASAADKNPVPTVRVFDDVQRLAPGNYWVRNGSLEGVLNEFLEFSVPFNRQSISKVKQGLLLRTDQKNYLVGISDVLASQEFSAVQFYGNWIRLQQASDIQLYDLRENKIVRAGLDTLWFENELAFAKRHDSLTVYLKSGLALNFDPGIEVSFIRSSGSSEFFLVQEKNRKIIFDSRTGKKMFSCDADEVEALGNRIFMVTDRNKKGLLSESGKVVLPVEYTAIIPAAPGVVSLLKDKKFGLYRIGTRKLLKPVYDRNLIPISPTRLVAYRDGAYGFISWDAKPQGLFEFEEVRSWNDTAALVRKNFQWMIYNITTGKVTIDKIKDYRFVSNGPEEKVVIVHRENFYGILSNRRGFVIPANFTELINVGSEEDPVYFAEKNVEEAAIYVVIYYDKNGKFIRKEVYEEEEYDRINCPRSH